ncbi:MAG: type II toxin-antitoxin system death-on-curing family toxin [Acidimicrobiales bacterium]
MAARSSALDGNEGTEYLDLDDVIALAIELLGDPPPVRDMGLLGSAVARPQTSAGGEDAYGDLWTKAAALLQSIVKNDALVDGNKRLGWLATAVFLDLNGIDATVIPNDGVYDFVMDVASGHDEVDVLATRLRRLTTGVVTRRRRGR